MQDTILITGATGNVGSQVVKQLVPFKEKVRAAVQSKGKADEIKNMGAELVEMNFNKVETIDAALKEVQKLFLLTPLVPNMVEMTTNLVEQAKKSKVSHIVKQSVFVLDPEFEITANKLHSQAEKIVQSSGINYTFLRPVSFMQNYLSFGDSIKKQGAFYQPLGDSKTSFVDVRDIAAVAVAALTKSREHKDKAYDITGPVPISNYEIAEILSDVSGKSDSATREEMMNAGMQEWTINTLMEMSDFQKAGKASVVSHDVELVTGRKPISFAQFANDYAESFKH